jgi:hypothetical protein
VDGGTFVGFETQSFGTNLNDESLVGISATLSKCNKREVKDCFYKGLGWS